MKNFDQQLRTALDTVVDGPPPRDWDDLVTAGRRRRARRIRRFRALWATCVVVPLAAVAVFVGASRGTTTDVAGSPGRQVPSSAAPAPDPGDGPPHENADNFRAAYGFAICGTFEAPLNDLTSNDVNGIHTHGDGLIHIHPFTPAASGTNATLSVWGDAVGVRFDDDGWTLPDGRTFGPSSTCSGRAAQPKLYVWSHADPGAAPTIVSSGFGRFHLDDGQVLVFAVVPMGTDVPRPPSESLLDQLTSVTPGTPGTTDTTTSTTR